MALKNLSACLLALVALMTTAGGGRNPQVEVDTWLRGCPADKATAVRFYYTPVNPDHVYYPLVFRPAPRGDPRLDTAPLVPEGRTAYISTRDMRHLIRALAAVHLSWSKSESVAPLAYFKKLVTLPAGMQILVVCSTGTATAQVQPRDVCNTLEPLDSALSAPRALWNFQAFRFDRGCKVPGFKVGLYPEGK